MGRLGLEHGGVDGVVLCTPTRSVSCVYVCAWPRRWRGRYHRALAHACSWQWLLHDDHVHDEEGVKEEGEGEKEGEGECVAGQQGGEETRRGGPRGW